MRQIAIIAFTALVTAIIVISSAPVIIASSPPASGIVPATASIDVQHLTDDANTLRTEQFPMH